MTMLRPLQQWTCDYCRHVIQAANEGVLEWIEDGEHQAYGFRVVHYLPASPIKSTREAGCYHYADQPHNAEERLGSFLGPDGLARLLLFLDVGSEHRPLPVASARELAECCRRLLLPYYEEARLYWGAATEDGFFRRGNRAWAYLEATLKSIIDEYGPKTPRS
jgi:hypothetical protein